MRLTRLLDGEKESQKYFILLEDRGIFKLQLLMRTLVVFMLVTLPQFFFDCQSILFSLFRNSEAFANFAGQASRFSVIA